MQQQLQVATGWSWPLYWWRLARSPEWCLSALLQAGPLFWDALLALPCLQLLLAAYGALFSFDQSQQAQQSAQRREQVLRAIGKATFTWPSEGTCRHTKMCCKQ